MPSTPSSVFGHFKQIRRSLPVIRHDLVVNFLHRQGWFNGSVNLGTYVGEKFHLMDAPSVASYMRTHDWVAKALAIAEDDENILEEAQLMALLPKAYLRESESTPWIIQAAFKLFHWCYTVESETAFTLALDDDRYFPHIVRKYLPPNRARWRFFRRCTDQSLHEKVREKYLLHYLPLVNTIAWRMSQGFPQNVELADLVSTGCIGLSDALERFDPERKVRFETYAAPRIRGAILDELRELDWVPRSVRRFDREHERALIQLTHEFGCTLPPLQAVADRLNITYDRLIENLFDTQREFVTSLDDLAYDASDDDTHEVTRIQLVEGDEPSALTLISFRQLVQNLEEAIKELSVQEQVTIILYYWHDYSLKRIGTRLGLSESRASQIKTKAEQKIRTKLCKQYKITNPTRWYEACLIAS